MATPPIVRSPPPCGGLPHLHPDLEVPPPALHRRLNRRPRLYRAGVASMRALQRPLAVDRINPLRRLRLAQLRRPDDNRLTIDNFELRRELRLRISQFSRFWITDKVTLTKAADEIELENRQRSFATTRAYRRKLLITIQLLNDPVPRALPSTWMCCPQHSKPFI